MKLQKSYIIEKELNDKVVELAKEDQRSESFIMNLILKRYFENEDMQKMQGKN